MKRAGHVPDEGAPEFPAGFGADLLRLMAWRRDVRHFRPDPLPEGLLERALDAFRLAPSVGLSEPWRLVQVASPAARHLAQANFEKANQDALAGYSGDKARLYARLKLSGMHEAPVQIAVFCDEGTAKGAGLGAASMPETRAYSCVAAITAFWLALRSEGVGLGWVSILDPEALTRALDVPAEWRLVAYLCIGYPESNSREPELETLKWERRSRALVMETR